MSGFEEDFVKKTNEKPMDLEILSVSELQERISALKSEILRCEQAIEKKSASMNAANALFSKPAN